MNSNSKSCRSCLSIGEYFSNFWKKPVNTNNLNTSLPSQVSSDEDFRWHGLGVEMPRKKKVHESELDFQKEVNCQKKDTLKPIIYPNSPNQQVYTQIRRNSIYYLENDSN